MEDTELLAWYSDEGRCPIKRLTEHVLKYNPDLIKEREYSPVPVNVYRRKWNSRNSIRLAMSSRMYYSLRKAKGNCHWEDYVDYSISELKQHLELSFEPGMSWDNYGQWEIDHVIPLSSFKYSSPDDLTFKQCWSLTNLQPLWKHDNRTKSGTVQLPRPTPHNCD